MKYSGLIKNDIANSDSGINVSVWLQGCPFRCKGCHNPETWDFNGGMEIDENTLIEETIGAINANGINRNLSILGGEPLFGNNLEFTKKLINTIKEKFPNIKIYIWTGFEMSMLQNDKKYKYILDTIDVLITGRFILERRNIMLPLRGSTNQRIWRRNKIGNLVLDTSQDYN
jgi:anaerobic ribonucleoside-triphosphate reductase activating protein